MTQYAFRWKFVVMFNTQRKRLREQGPTALLLSQAPRAQLRRSCAEETHLVQLRPLPRPPQPQIRAPLRKDQARLRRPSLLQILRRRSPIPHPRLRPRVAQLPHQCKHSFPPARPRSASSTSPPSPTTPCSPPRHRVRPHAREDAALLGSCTTGCARWRRW